MRASLRRMIRGGVAGILCWGVWGCQSLNTPASASFASVKVGGRTLEEIRAETVRVFKGAGYEATPTADGFVFEREGTRRDQIAYGSAIDDEGIRVRVKLQIVALGGELYRLQCTAYAVRPVGTGMDDEIRLPRWRRGPFLDLLEQVSRNLGSVNIVVTE